jgi:hypothetical protein
MIRCMTLFVAAAFLLLGPAIAGLAAAQKSVLLAAGPAPDNLPRFVLLPANNALAPSLDMPADGAALALTPVALPRMAPDLALRVYQRLAAQQEMELSSYFSTTIIRARLPDASQCGEYELREHYAAPRTLEFQSVRFTGDGFVKNNVITRVLRSEANHLQKDDTSLTAITIANYKFSYKGASQVGGRPLHVYQLRPRRKRVGLFKGRIYLDASTGSLVRAEGSMVKSPSFFIQKIDFVQDYENVGSFTFPVHIHSEARTRLVGRAIVDIFHCNYQPVANTAQVEQVPSFQEAYRDLVLRPLAGAANGIVDLRSVEQKPDGN